jgi:DNA invertase Pin-like site-specific DNA recombinase
MASIAQEESRKTSERIKWGLRRKIEDGFVLGCEKMFGYRTRNGKMTIVPE